MRQFRSSKCIILAHGLKIINILNILTLYWKIAMELELYKNGHIATTASKTKSNTSYYSASTKWVSGKDSDDWTAEGIFRVFDDNGTKIHEQELYVD